MRAKSEGEMSKRLAAVAMQSRIGAEFDAIVTGVTAHERCPRAANRTSKLLAQARQGIDLGE